MWHLPFVCSSRTPLPTPWHCLWPRRLICVVHILCLECPGGAPQEIRERERERSWGQVIYFLSVSWLCPSTNDQVFSPHGLEAQLSPCGGQQLFPPTSLPASWWQCLAAAKLGLLPYPCGSPTPMSFFVNKPSSNYPILNVPSVSCWETDWCSGFYAKISLLTVSWLNFNLWCPGIFSP